MKQDCHFSAIVNHGGETFFIDACQLMPSGKYEMDVYRMSQSYPDQKELRHETDVIDMPMKVLSNVIKADVDWDAIYTARFKTVAETEEAFNDAVDDLTEILKTVDDKYNTRLVEDDRPDLEKRVAKLEARVAQIEEALMSLSSQLSD